MNVLKKIASQFAWSVMQSRLLDPIRPRICHIQAYYIEGKTKRAHDSFSALFFGPKETAHFFSKISFSETSVFKNLGNIYLNNIPTMMSKTKPDVVFIAANNVFSNFFISKDFFVLPNINFILDISMPMELILSRMEPSKRRLLHKIARLAYSHEITKNIDKLKMFYNEMYLPHIISRHGKSAEAVSFNECKRFLARGGLLLAKLDGEYVSGALFVSNGDELYIPILAVNEANKNLKQGVGLAPLYFLILWGKKMDYNSIDYGSCPPFLKNGLFRYKREWGMQIKSVKDSESRILGIKFCNFEKEAMEFLFNNPFVFEYNDQLAGLALLESSKNFYKAYKIPGLSKFVILNVFSNQNIESDELGSFSLKIDHRKVPHYLVCFLETVSKKGYEAYALDL